MISTTTGWLWASWEPKVQGWYCQELPRRFRERPRGCVVAFLMIPQYVQQLRPQNHQKAILILQFHVDRNFGAKPITAQIRLENVFGAKPITSQIRQKIFSVLNLSLGVYY